MSYRRPRNRYSRRPATIVGTAATVVLVGALIALAVNNGSSSPFDSQTIESLTFPVNEAPSAPDASPTTASIDTGGSTPNGSDPLPTSELDTADLPGRQIPDVSILANRVTAETIPDTSPRTATDLVPLRTIQLVPAVRDVIVDVDGMSYTSDSAGLISLDAAAPDSIVEFVGIRDFPSLRRVTVERWADGNQQVKRQLGDIAGPSTELGIEVRHRVTVTSQRTPPDGSRLVLNSPAGPLILAVGRASWATAMRAIETDAGLEAQMITYETSQMVMGLNVLEITPQVFTPTPEALWVADLTPA